MRPIGLSNQQLDALYAGALPLPAACRAEFVEAVMRELHSLPEIGDADVFRAVVTAQRRYFDPPNLARAVPRARRTSSAG